MYRIVNRSHRPSDYTGYRPTGLYRHPYMRNYGLYDDYEALITTAPQTILHASAQASVQAPSMHSLLPTTHTIHTTLPTHVSPIHSTCPLLPNRSCPASHTVVTHVTTPAAPTVTPLSLTTTPLVIQSQPLTTLPLSLTTPAMPLSTPSIPLSTASIPLSTASIPLNNPHNNQHNGWEATARGGCSRC